MASKKANLEEATPQTDPRAPLNGAAFLKKAQGAVKALAVDILARVDASHSLTAALEARWKGEHAAQRTADPFEVWRRRYVAQVAAAWLLSCVFVRVLEDRGLVDRNRIAGPGAQDSQRQFLDFAPFLTERDYLQTVFRELGRLPAGKELFDPQHNPVFRIAPSAEGAHALLELFRSPSADAPHFRFGQSDTDFLGDLYQDLDEEVRSRFALLQTPRFVVDFILDRTLEPAIEEFGLDAATILDPTCGSGHFLLAAFDRIVAHRLRTSPGLDVRDAAKRALAAVHGVDINPYAVAIARFRLLLACVEKGGYAKLKDAPGLESLARQVVVADSLLHGAPSSGQQHIGDAPGAKATEWKGEEFALEDDAAAKALFGKEFAAVVGNPPYITVKDAALREVYRRMYTAAGGKYALSAPFAERFFQLVRKAGFVGQITANSFMKREFGKSLIEEVLPKLDLNLIANTSGAYIPGHGTPTVLLFGRNRPPTSREVLAVLAKRGEPTTPEDAAKGLVWASIEGHWSEVGYENDYVSVANVARESLDKHPWSLGGGGASELKELLEERAEKRLGDVADDIGFASFTGLDDAFILPECSSRTLGIEPELVRPMVIGEVVRDWAIQAGDVAIVPYNQNTQTAIRLDTKTNWAKFLWRYRACSESVVSFGNKTRKEQGDNWWEWYRWQAERYQVPFRITFAFVATHNHFVLDRGGKVFNRSAPIIKLPDTATEEDHLALLAYLNSSTACFWMKQIFYPKASGVGDISTEKGKEEANRYEFAGTGLSNLPVPSYTPKLRSELVRLGREADELGAARERTSGRSAVDKIASAHDGEWPRIVKQAAEERARCLRRLVTIQEDIDWLVYAAVGFTDEFAQATVREAMPTDRPFATAAGGSHADPVVRRRASLLAKSDQLRFLETSVFKRPWWGRQGVFGHSSQNFDDDVRDAARAWIAERAELALSSTAQILGVRDIARVVLSNPGAARVASIIAGNGEPDGSVAGLIASSDAVPFLAAQRFTDAGLEKHRQWERTWDLQRREDAGEDIGAIPVPPKYDVKDFRDQAYWRLRGKLDVPKERFISYPGCESDEDHQPVYGWAGWNHLQQAQALAALYQSRKTNEAWEADRLIPMLAGLDELVPWLKHWHNEPSDEFGGLRLGDYFADFVAAQCLECDITLEDLRAWRPTQKRSARMRKAAAAKSAPSTPTRAQPAIPAPSPRERVVALSDVRAAKTASGRPLPRPSEPPPAPATTPRLAKTRGAASSPRQKAATRRRA